MSLPATLTPTFSLPFLIFIAEMAVVTLCTLRIIAVARGMKLLAPLLGCFEIMIWLFAIGQIMQNLNHIGCYLAFAGGFTFGNFLGVWIEQKLALGHLLVRVVTRNDSSELALSLRAASYGVTQVDGRGATGPVQVLFTIIRRKCLADVLALIKQHDPRAFYSVDDLHSTASGIFPLAQRSPSFSAASLAALAAQTAPAPPQLGADFPPAA